MYHVKFHKFAGNQMIKPQLHAVHLERLGVWGPFGSCLEYQLQATIKVYVVKCSIMF